MRSLQANTLTHFPNITEIHAKLSISKCFFHHYFFLFKIYIPEPGMVLHAYSFSTQEAEAGGL
jgi:hypothetical protein